MIHQRVKGTNDLLPEQMRRFLFLEDKFREFLKLYGYQEMKTPVFEYTDVFKKENDTSDMVTKEMYTFTMNDDYSLTLRPEGSAGIVRSLIENKMYSKNELPLKLAYIEEMFRHEHWQRGRQRQFTQYGIECIGDKVPLIDAEVIALGYFYIKSLGIKGIKVVINSLGDTVSRLAYKEVLKDYFHQYENELCSDCQNRLNKNPLRILDCKVDRDKDFVKNAPEMKLSSEAEDYFNEVRHHLDILNIPYEIDKRLVRGLDYYTDTVFEVISTNEKSGSQSTIFGGGRYDNLIKEMGGPELSGVGFAIGAERLMILAEAENIFQDENSIDAYVINLYVDSDYAFDITNELRSHGLSCEIDYYHRSLKAQFKSAERKNARFIIIVGEDEIRDKTVTIKDKTDNRQETLIRDKLINRLKELLN